jgi:phosphatidylserine/phosphatidylglycerophosphate/cardiolipin synthase-like enzyme
LIYSKKSGPNDKDKKANPALADYTFEDQYRWMGWQARECIVEMLDEILNDPALSIDVFAFDLNDPVICESLIQLAIDGRARVILDNSPGHVKPTAMETKFEALFTKNEKTTNSLVRGYFRSLSHSKVFIQKRKGRPEKVLTGSTNFSTNGLYINANHVLVFKDKKVAELYSSVFENSFGQSLMNKFAASSYGTNEFKFSGRNLPKTLIRFSPHPKAIAEDFFALISQRILKAKTDVLFAIMKDNSKSSILDAVMEQVQSDKVFTYGITDTIGDKTKIYLYKPDSKRGVRVAGKPGQFILPPPFEKERSIPGISIHHKFVVVDFKGKDPVVYCGSSNLAFGPEQKNGDNLIQIRDKDAVTAFAVEAIRLVDHFHFRNSQFIEQQSAKDKKPVLKPVFLRASKDKKWVDAYYNKKDLLYMERTLLIK